MSFILDALKKSESERQRQSIPGLLDVPVPARQRRFPVWGVLLGLLMGVNLVVLLVVLVRSESRNPGASPSVAAPAAAPSMPPAATARTAMPAGPTTAGTATGYAPGAVADAAPPGSTPFSPMDAAPLYAPEIPVAQDGETARGPVDAPAAPAMQSQMPARAPRPTLPPQARIPEDPNEIVPTLQELNLSGNHSIPDLHLDIHVYSSRPADRFVFINNRKYKEGATLQEGPTVERITRDGVVLRYQNLRFSIPRQ